MPSQNRRSNQGRQRKQHARVRSLRNRNTLQYVLRSAERLDEEARDHHRRGRRCGQLGELRQGLRHDRGRLLFLAHCLVQERTWHSFHALESGSPLGSEAGDMAETLDAGKAGKDGPGNRAGKPEHRDVGEGVAGTRFQEAPPTNRMTHLGTGQKERHTPPAAHGYPCVPGDVAGGLPAPSQKASASSGPGPTHRCQCASDWS
mmetsp:Transcript_99662/g.266260  ORF Transcript_99662/g.266260 Transcript_99662/m.266260 type:complete len:203 (-) Transcript_99662:1008-1616(-)